MFGFRAPIVRSDCGQLFDFQDCFGALKSSAFCALSFFPVGGSGGREFIGIIQVVPVDKRQKS